MLTFLKSNSEKINYVMNKHYGNTQWPELYTELENFLIADNNTNSTHCRPLSKIRTICAMAS